MEMKNKLIHIRRLLLLLNRIQLGFSSLCPKAQANESVLLGTTMLSVLLGRNMQLCFSRKYQNLSKAIIEETPL